MTTPVISRKSFLLSATLACTLTLWASMDGAVAHGHHSSDNHHDSGNSGNHSFNHSNHHKDHVYSSSKSKHHHHHKKVAHHHHHKKVTKGPVHGPGSSHNPIVYHPVHGSGSSHNPILATQPVVRDHRHPGFHAGGPNGSASSPEGGVTVTSGSGRRKVVVPTQLDSGQVHAEPGNGAIVHDHR